MAKFLDLKGGKFGNLIAIYRIKDSEHKGYASWLCKCDCGSKVVVNTKKIKTRDDYKLWLYTKE